MDTEFKYTPEQFAQLVKAYHQKTEIQLGEFPDLAGLKNTLELEDDEYEAMDADPAYHRICLWAMRRRESYLNRAALKVKNTTGIKMLLQQPENGGYVEKPVDKSPRQVEVTLRGMFNGSDFDSDDDADNDSVLPADQAEDDDGETAGTADQSVGKHGRAKGKTR